MLTLPVLFATFLLQPFLRNPSSNQVITYDDPDSLSLKGQFVKQSAMAGVNVWEISGDDNGSSPPSPPNPQLCARRETHSLSLILSVQLGIWSPPSEAAWVSRSAFNLVVPLSRLYSVCCTPFAFLSSQRNPPSAPLYLLAT